MTPTIESITNTEGMLKHVVSALNRCIEIDLDAEKGFGLAAADARDPELKQSLEQKAHERATFVQQIQSAVLAMDKRPENEGTAMGAAHRGWTTARRLVEGRSDRLIVEECLNGELAGIERYEAAISSAPMELLPMGVHDILKGHFQSMQSSITDLRARLGIGADFVS